jgi:hypothetical protein
MRIETPEVGSGYFLIDNASGTSVLVFSAHPLFMNAPSSRATQVFMPVDPNANPPCRQWQRAAAPAAAELAVGAGRCERVAATAGRHRLLEYRITSPDGQLSRVWISPELGVAVKFQASDGATIALEHIRVEPQAASLFAIPEGYRRIDPQALIELMKHSDVWAETPK